MEPAVADDEQRDEYYLCQKFLSLAKPQLHRSIPPHGQLSRRKLEELLQLQALALLLEPDEDMVCSILKRGKRLTIASNVGFTDKQKKKTLKLFDKLSSGRRSEKTKAFRKIRSRMRLEIQEDLGRAGGVRKRKAEHLSPEQVVDEEFINARASHLDKAIEWFPRKVLAIKPADVWTWILSDSARDRLHLIKGMSLEVVEAPCKQTQVYDRFKLVEVMKKLVKPEDMHPEKAKLVEFLSREDVRPKNPEEEAFARFAKEFASVQALVRHSECQALLQAAAEEAAASASQKLNHTSAEAAQSQAPVQSAAGHGDVDSCSSRAEAAESQAPVESAPVNVQSAAGDSAEAAQSQSLPKALPQAATEQFVNSAGNNVNTSSSAEEEPKRDDMDAEWFLVCTKLCCPSCALEAHKHGCYIVGCHGVVYGRVEVRVEIQNEHLPVLQEQMRLFLTTPFLHGRRRASRDAEPAATMGSHCCLYEFLKSFV